MQEQCQVASVIIWASRCHVLLGGWSYELGANEVSSPRMASPPRPLRILHVIATPLGAPWLVALAREQQRLGHEISVVLPSLDGDITARLRPLGIPCYAAPVDIIGASHMTQCVRIVAGLVRLLRR